MAKKENSNKMVMIAGIILVVILAGLLIYYFGSGYIAKQERTAAIHKYKSDFYTSVVCEYGCPLKMFTLQNVSQLLPDPVCVKNCTTTFKNDKNNFSKAELDSDSLYSDMSNVVLNCRQTSTDTSNASVINSTNFFSCTVSGFEGLKTKYPYLN